MIRIIAAIMVVFLLTGCTGSRELENRDFVMAASIERNNDYNISVAVAKPSDGEDSSDQEEIIFEGRGNTIDDAIKNINNKTSGNIYLGHNKVIIISYKFNDYKDLVDYFGRNIEISRDTVIICSEKPTDILRAKNDSENASEYIYNYYKHKDKIDLNKLMDYYNNNKEITLPKVTSEEEKILIEQ